MGTGSKRILISTHSLSVLIIEVFWTKTARSPATKQENNFGFQKKSSGLSKNSSARHRWVAEWKTVYLDQLFSHSIFQSTWHFKSTPTYRTRKRLRQAYWLLNAPNKDRQSLWITGNIYSEHRESFITGMLWNKMRSVEALQLWNIN